MQVPSNDIFMDLLDNDIEIEEVNLDNTSQGYVMENFTEFGSDTDNKEYIKFVKRCEKLIRSSIEYKEFIGYLKNTLGFKSDSFLPNINIDEYKVTLEMHHYPFSLFDIVDIVIKKQSNDFTNSVNAYKIAEEVMELHYLGKIGILPLTKTTHELAHSGDLFISFDKVFGDFDKFKDEYYVYINETLLSSLQLLKEKTIEERKNGLKDKPKVLQTKIKILRDTVPMKLISDQLKIENKS